MNQFNPQKKNNHNKSQKLHYFAKVGTALFFLTLLLGMSIFTYLSKQEQSVGHSSTTIPQ